MEGSRRSKEPFKELTNITIQGTQTPHHVDPKERDREGKRRKGEQGAIQHIPNHRQVYTWRYRGDLGENKDRLHVGTGESDVGTGLINDKATLGEMEDLCNQSCISPLCEGGGTQTDARDSHPFIASNVFGVGKKKFNLIICQYRFYVSPAIHLSQKILGQHLMTLMTLQVLRHSHLLLTSYIQCLHMVDRAETHASMEEDDCDEKSYLRKMRKRMRGTIFGGQEPDYWKADEDVDLETANEDPNEPDVPDPYDAVYANVPNETHMLKPEDNCEHCNAKKFESEPPGFCCHSGKIHLSTPETPPELVRLWSSSNANARHFCANIRYFNGHFSFTSLYCKLDRVTTDMKNCGIYTFRAHNQIYHNIRSFGKEDGHEPRHLELYFYDDDPSLEHRLRKCREKSAQEDREVIQRLKDILHGINPYSENIRSIGQVDNLKDYHVELNLDQRLDQRTYNVPLTSEVATVWIEGSEHRGQFDNSVVLQGKDRSIHGIQSYHGCYDALSYPLFFPRGELGWHNCIPKVGVTEAEVNKA
ncbi:uncharacterized protein [Setaria viridis]|nr:uncharacterized protein LOC117859075 isoform X4 [Setaria viridis]XP_034598173.1 uncharacterized protein LOC117859075 isoform X4 [Setaria viridis]